MSATRPHIAHKHFRLDTVKLKRAQELMGASTETETIELALEEAIAERERNRRVRAAHDRFLRSGIVIRDLYNKLAD